MFIFSTQVSSTHYDAEQVGHVPSKAKYIHVWSPESRRIVCKESRPGPTERTKSLLIARLNSRQAVSQTTINVCSLSVTLNNVIISRTIYNNITKVSIWYSYVFFTWYSNIWYCNIWALEITSLSLLIYYY